MTNGPRPRITLSLSGEGVLEISVNEAGRDLLVRELRHLSEASDHFHLGPEQEGGEVPLETIAYRSDDAIIEWAKVMLRPDHWDAEFFPHVLEAGGSKYGR